MERTKGPQKKRSLPRPNKRNKPGPKSKCTEEVVEQAYRLCLLGLTNRELAVAFSVHEDSIAHWYRNYEDFRQAVNKGRAQADGEVAEALFKRALGYSHPAIKILTNTVTEEEYDEDGNVVSKRSYKKPMKVPYMKHYPPDTKAAIKWLGVRNRERWGESYKVQHEHSHMHVANINIHQVLEQIGNADMFTDEELKVAAKLGLSKAAKEITNGSPN